MGPLDRLNDTLGHPLWHVVCPHKDCGVRFGIEPNEHRFFEQTGSPLWCPRGHRLKLRAVSEVP